MQLPGYFSELSSESPFRSSNRFYGKPNRYHQVALYSIYEIRKVPVIEPVNGLYCKVAGHDFIDSIYGNVVTFKDQWSSSTKTYNNRLDEQINAIKSLPKQRTLIAGDFNLKLGWPQKAKAHRRMKEELMENGWIWPTELNDQSVQHVLHTTDLQVEISIDSKVKRSQNKKGLSDHPFINIEVMACL
jgi:hypothetical protein